MTTLKKRGYMIPKENLSIEEVNKIKNDLNVTPFVSENFALSKPTPFRIYLESKNNYFVPKFYGLKNFGYNEHIKLNKGEEIDVHFKGKPRPKQLPVINKFMDACKETSCYFDTNKGGIITLKCGGGKTVISLYCITKLKRKTLIIVHKTFLMNQWRDRILEFIPDASIGYIQGSNIDVEGKDIVIGMLQSISQKDYDLKIFKDFGFTIVDECHHIGAETFSKSLFKINSYYMLGLSATPKRKDGLSMVFELFLGDYVYKEIDKKSVKTEVNLIYYNDDSGYNQEKLMYNGKVNVPKMVNNICENTNRTKMIINIIKLCIEEPSTQILILSDRRNHLSEIHDLITKEEICTVGFYVGGMKEKDLKLSESKKVLLGTYSMSSEGMDIPTLNTLIMASPKSDIEQSIGRIQRKAHEIVPRIFDIVDDFSTFGNQKNKRITLYRKFDYDVYNCDMNDLNKKELIEKKKRGRSPKKKVEYMFIDE